MFNITCDIENNYTNVCYACRSPSKKLIECNELESDMVSRNYCDGCLVSKEVPVYRQSLKIWSFGRVMSFCSSNRKHTVEFLSGEREAVSVGSSPFRSYQCGDESRNDDIDDADANTDTDVNTNTNTNIDDIATEIIPFDEDECTPSGKKRPPSVQLFADDPLWNHILQDLIMDNEGAANADTNTTNATAHIIGSDSDEPRNDSISKQHQHDEIIDTIITTNNNNSNVKNHNNTKKRRRSPSYSSCNLRFSHSQSLESQQSSHAQSQSSPRKRPKKSCPQPWGHDEDYALVRAVRSAAHPVRWPSIAEQLFGRTAKQCRERYVNQLDPSLKDSDEWSAAEDAFVFNLYHTFGAQWAKIASLMAGRTDNAVKNRFHHTRRKMEKETNRCNKNSKGKDDAAATLAKTLQKEVDARKTSSSTGFRKKVSDAVGHAAAKCLLSAGGAADSRNDVVYDGDRFRSAKPGERCSRCCLFLPSKQCGTKLCRRTNWCKTCVNMPTYVCRDSLYDAVKLVAEHRHEVVTPRASD